MSAQRQANRESFPQTAKIVDEFRSVFGPGIRLLWAEEDGRTIGKRPEQADV